MRATSWKPKTAWLSDLRESCLSSAAISLAAMLPTLPETISQEKQMSEILSVNGKTIYSSNTQGVRECVIEAIAKGVSLKGAYLHGLDLSGIEFVNSDLEDVAFIHCNLEGARFKRSNLSRVKIVECRANRVKIETCAAPGLSVTDTSMQHAMITSSVLDAFYAADSTLSGLRALGVSFLDAILYRSTIERGALNNCNFKGASLEGTWLAYTEIRGSIFNMALIDDANFFQSSWIDCQMNQARVTRTDFEEASIKASLMMNASFTETGFNGAAIESTSFYRSKFSECSFMDADLSSVSLSKVIHDGVALRNGASEMDLPPKIQNTP